LVETSALAEKTLAALRDRMSFWTPLGEQILSYPVPEAKGETEPERQRLNFV
jgi:hypothetical protein